MKYKLVIISFTSMVLAMQPLYAAKSQPQKVVNEEKLVIDFFTTMCLGTGGKTEKIEELLGKAASELDKKTIVGDQYTMKQTEDVWMVPNSASKEPYILSVTKSNICYVGVNASNPKKLRQDFRNFAATQASNIRAKVVMANPEVEFPEGMQIDFYDIKMPGTSHVIKFSLAVPSNSDPAVRSTMTIASE
jgi:hypothetical protein